MGLSLSMRRTSFLHRRCLVSLIRLLGSSLHELVLLLRLLRHPLRRARHREGRGCRIEPARCWLSRPLR